MISSGGSLLSTLVIVPNPRPFCKGVAAVAARRSPERSDQ